VDTINAKCKFSVGARSYLPLDQAHFQTVQRVAVRTRISQTLYDLAISTFLDASVVVFVRSIAGEVLANSVSKHPINKNILRTKLNP